MTGRLVIVLEQAADLGGQERVLQALLEHYPTATALAPGFVPTNRPPGHVAPWDERTRLISTSRGPRRQFLAPLYARRIARAGVLDADVAVSIAHSGWSVGARLPASTPHVCYSSGLPPHLYGFSRHYLRDQPLAMRPALAAAIPALRAYDKRLMRRPGRLIANSNFSARELEHAHGRRVDVVYPPVRTHFFTPGEARERAGGATAAGGSETTPKPRPFLMVARLVSLKLVDVVVEAFRSLPDEQLVVAGAGPALARLRRTAPPNVTLVGAADDAALLNHYRSSRALICPSRETFGIAMGEAQACGIPVIAARAGSAPEVVKEGVTGILLGHPDPRSIAEAVRAFPSKRFEPRACRESATRFAQEKFTAAMDRVLREELSAVAGPQPRVRRRARSRSSGQAIWQARR